MKYESRHASHVFHFSHGYLYLTSFPSFIPRFRIEILVIWRIITSLALWIIWTTWKFVQFTSNPMGNLSFVMDKLSLFVMSSMVLMGLHFYALIFEFFMI